MDRASRPPASHPRARASYHRRHAVAERAEPRRHGDGWHVGRCGTRRCRPRRLCELLVFGVHFRAFGGRPGNGRTSRRGRASFRDGHPSQWRFADRADHRRSFVGSADHVGSRVLPDPDQRCRGRRARRAVSSSAFVRDVRNGDELRISGLLECGRQIDSLHEHADLDARAQHLPQLGVDLRQPRRPRARRGRCRCGFSHSHRVRDGLLFRSWSQLRK